MCRVAILCPGVALRCILNDEFRAECVVCFEDFLGFDDGVVCAATSDVHFVCNGCFLASVQSAITDTMAKQTMREGKIACPYSTFPPTANSCRSECFPDKTVAEKVDEQLFAAYQRQRDLLAEARCANEQRLEMDRRLDLAIKKMEQEGVKVFKARKFIEEEILTMHCPRCKMAFADWDGCNGESRMCPRLNAMSVCVRSSAMHHCVIADGRATSSGCSAVLYLRRLRLQLLRFLP